MKPTKVNTSIYLSTLVILVMALSLLIWVRSQFVNEMESAVKSIKSHFSMETLIKSPDDIQINFGRIAEVANNNLRNPFIKELYVSKVIRGKGEHIIHPFYYSSLNKNWKETLNQKGWIKEPLKSGDETFGYLYIKLNNSAQSGVTAAAVFIAALIIASVILFLTRLRAQEIVISKTTIELKEKQQELIHLERLALAGRLTANIFHDIKKPALNIKHQISDIEDAENLSEPEKKLCADIKTQIDLFFSMLRELNIERFVQIGTGDDKEYFSVNELLERSLNLVKYEQDNVEIIRQYSENIEPVYVNQRHIIQVFSNIILNAYHSMNGTGRLYLKTSQENGRQIISIKDNGPGISDEVKEKLFQPFISTKKENEGSGLGLYISKNIITSIGGDITAISGAGNDADKGAEFRIEIKSE